MGSTAPQQPYPTLVEDIYSDYTQRKAGLLRALTTDSEQLFVACRPDQENLCLYGTRDGKWHVGPPAEEVPPELPEPCLGINFARDGMARKEWLALLAVHSDTWLLSVAFYFAVKLDSAERLRLFKLINSGGPTLFEVVTQRHGVKHPAGAASNGGAADVGQAPMKKAKMDRPHTSPFPTGKPLTELDVSMALQGRLAELFWPDDKKWYLVEIQQVNVKARRANIVYASGEFEDVDLAEILRDGHMALL